MGKNVPKNGGHIRFLAFWWQGVSTYQDNRTVYVFFIFKYIGSRKLLKLYSTPSLYLKSVQEFATHFYSYLQNKSLNNTHIYSFFLDILNSSQLSFWKLEAFLMQNY